MPNQSGLQRSNTERTRKAREKAIQAIADLKKKGEQVNFSIVSQKSGISRHFLYEDPETRKAIEHSFFIKSSSDLMIYFTDGY